MEKLEGGMRDIALSFLTVCVNTKKGGNIYPVLADLIDLPEAKIKKEIVNTKDELTAEDVLTKLEFKYIGEDY